MRYKQSSKGIIVHLLLCCVLVGFFTLPMYLIKRNTNYMEIGDKFIISKTGILSKKTIETAYKRIDSVLIEKGMMGSMLGYGNIIILSGSSRHLLENVDNPEEIKRMIEDKI